MSVKTIILELPCTSNEQGWFLAEYFMQGGLGYEALVSKYNLQNIPFSFELDVKKNYFRIVNNPDLVAEVKELYNA